MVVDVLVVGQGICGTFLAWNLENAGLSYIVIDAPYPNTASKSAAGIINPVTGRRIVKTWMIDEILPFARQQYTLLGAQLGISCIRQTDIIDFFTSPQMRLSFLKRHGEDPTFLLKPEDESGWLSHFKYDFGYGVIQPCLQVELANILATFRRGLEHKHQLISGKFDFQRLVIEGNTVSYDDIHASSIVFCDGNEGAVNPFFKALPFAPNKGEALIVHIPELPAGHIYKKGLNLAPMGENLFWAGSTYEWDFKNSHPSEAFRNNTLQLLENWLRGPVELVDHIASIRPATLERRPFAGFHPVHTCVGILNGMGSKGCSLAPYFAMQLVQQITGQGNIDREADIQRFRNLLSRL